MHLIHLILYNSQLLFICGEEQVTNLAQTGQNIAPRTQKLRMYVPMPFTKRGTTPSKKKIKNELPRFKTYIIKVRPTSIEF